MTYNVFSGTLDPSVLVLWHYYVPWSRAAAAAAGGGGASVVVDVVVVIDSSVVHRR